MSPADLRPFCATEFAEEGVMFARIINAYGWPEAEFICKALGWRLDGELIDSLDEGEV